MIRTTAVLLVFADAIGVVAAQTRNSKNLDIYLVDVEGGNATLFVGPARESLLIDTGNGGHGSSAGRGSDYGRC